MTEEEKQKAEQFAEEHAFRVPYDGSNNFYDDTDYRASKDGYIEGATENGIQWHKVTDWKKQEQFPNDETELYLVYINLKYLKIKQYVVCNLDITDGFRQFYDDDSNDEIDPEDVIAWCEIPQFKE